MNTVLVTIEVPGEIVPFLPKLFSGMKITNAQRKKDVDVTVDDVIKFCEERHSSVDGLRFYNYYSRRGWLDASGIAIDDWRSKVIEWERNGLDQKNKPVINKTYDMLDRWSANG